MWIKASGTELSDALTDNIFVAVDPMKARLEIDGVGDGSCRSALIDSECGLRPSIETTFHAMFDRAFVFHFHSVATICHAVSEDGRQLLNDKLAGLAWVRAPYRKPGIPLTKAIQDVVGDSSVDVVVLDNHGVIVLGDTVKDVSELIDDVERRLDLPDLFADGPDSAPEIPGWESVPTASFLAFDETSKDRAVSGTYYPDHVVFMGPGLPLVLEAKLREGNIDDAPFPAAIVKDAGVFIKQSATESQRAMLDCLANVLRRIPGDWTMDPIGRTEEEKLLNWDAEKYRQMLAAREA